MLRMKIFDVDTDTQVKMMNNDQIDAKWISHSNEAQSSIWGMFAAPIGILLAKPCLALYMDAPSGVMCLKRPN